MRPHQLADAMKGPPQDVKWAPEGASASPNFPAKTAIAAPLVTFTTLSASVSYFWSYGTDCTHLLLVCLITQYVYDHTQPCLKAFFSIQQLW